MNENVNESSRSVIHCSSFELAKYTFVSFSIYIDLSEKVFICIFLWYSEIMLVYARARAREREVRKERAVMSSNKYRETMREALMWPKG